MLFHNEDGRHPSLLVEDGETVTISARDAHENGIPIQRMRPRTTAALLVLAGQQFPSPPRLSDRAAFEQIETTEGLVNLSKLDQDGRIAGYSVSFIRGILSALDPKERVPPKSVRRLIPLDNENNHCCCSSKRHLTHKAKNTLSASSTNTVSLAEASTSPQLTHSFREAFVPEFLVNLQVSALFTRLGDIVIGHNATLIMGPDISYAIADNILGYHGSRIVQRGSYLNVDVIATMRGGILNRFHTVTDTLKVNWHELALQPPTKP
jgi:hypothetical protein